jgi:ATP-binding cassette subfamily F protein 3
MVSVNNLTLSFGGFDLFKGVSFQLNDNERVGLVGKNGAGKTTMLRLIAGEIKPTSGSVSLSGDIKLGYLPQQMKLASGNTVLDEAKKAFAEIKQIKSEITKLTEQIATRTDYESKEYLALISKLTDLNDRYTILDGDTADARAEQTLLGLGFERTDFARPTTEFSGGWRMRIELAKILLQNPQVLLLDEPTNHLDIESIQWLEEYLKNFQGTLLLISHDRAFLDNVTQRTIEISLGKVYDYRVPYTKYVELRRERREQQLAAYRNQQKLIEDTQDFIERFRYKATKAVQVQSRIKMLERMDVIEIEEEDNSTVNIRFPEAPRSGDIVVEAKGLAKSFDTKQVFADAHFTIERGEKVAFVGRNGEGKTTMSRIIVGELSYDGELKIGHNVTIGYFAQNQDEILDNSLTVLETIDRVAVGDIRTKIRDILGAFLFRGEDVDKRVSVLSGGERNRLALAKLMLQPYNLLVLDEPTNHLDMRSKDVLKNALLEYNGTVIIVSHDRDFLNGLVNKVYEFTHGKVKEHIGGIYDFLRRKKLETLKELEAVQRQQKSTDKTNAPSDQKKLWEERKELDRKIRKVENQINKLEQEISSLESELSEIDNKLTDPAAHGIDLSDKEFFTNYEGKKEDLATKMEQWEDLATQLDKLKQQRNKL